MMDPLRGERIEASTSMPRRISPFTKSGITSPWLHSTALSGTSSRTARDFSNGDSSVRRSSITISSPAIAASG
jgi:hypothetical protein